MGLLKQWRDVAYSQQADKAKLQKFWAEYFVIEKGIYEQLLSNPDEVVRGTVKELADKYKVNVMTMTGFLDGINDSLKVQNPIEEMEEDTEVNLGFDKELLYKNMVDAKADWLYELPMWDEIFTPEKKKTLYMEQKKSGTIIKGAKVTRLHKNDQNVLTGITYEKDGAEHTMDGDLVISSMPVKDLVEGMNDVPEKPMAIAKGLPYRDYMTLGVLVPRLNLKNKTRFRTVGNIVPDCWVYVQDRRVKMGRFQIYNNWSPYMVKDLDHTVWIGLEYFVNEGDEFWNMSEEEFSAFGVKEMVKLGLIDKVEDAIDTHMERVKKAYPAYFDTYDEMDQLIDYLNTIPNLYCVGRNGQHRYNNIDHSMVTSFEAVKNILSGRTDKSNIWNVNTEKEYHEEKKA